MSYSSEVLTDAPLGYWKLNETSGTSMADSSGNGLAGTYSGAILGQTALHADNTAAAKGGTSGQGIGSVSAASFGTDESYSVEFWVKFNNTDDVKGLVARWAGSQGWIIWQRSGKIAFTILNGAGGQQDKFGPTFASGQTAHVVLVQDGSDVRLYVDGMLEVASTVTSTYTAGTLASTMQIGGYNGSNYSQATISDVAYYDHALTQERIAAHLGLAWPPPAVAPATLSGLKGLWDASAITGKVDGDAVTSWTDDSGNTKHAVSIGAGRNPVFKTGIVNGHPVVRFDGSDDGLDAASVLSADNTATVVIFAAVRTGGVTYAPFSIENSGVGMAIAISSGNVRGIFAPGGFVSYAGGTYTPGTFERWTLVGKAAASQLFVNGTIAMSAGALGSSTTLRMGGSASQGLYTPVDVAEMMVFDRPLTSYEVAQIDAYLTQKWLTTGVSGTGAATLPALTASAAGTVTAPPTTGTVAADLPALSTSASGTHTSNDQVGDVAATLPALTVDALGDFTPEPVTGDLAATLPALTAQIVDAGGDVDGALGATLPGLSAEAVARIQPTPAPWTADLSQRTLLLIRGATTSPTFVPPLAAIPASIVEHPLERASAVVPDLTTLPADQVRIHPVTGAIAVRDDVYDAFPVTREVVGVPHLFVDGRDVTYFRDSRTLVGEDRAAEPFGDQALTVDFPQITTLDDKDDPALSWLAADKTVHYVLQHWDETGPTGVVSTLFHGRLVSDDSGNDSTRPQKSWQARGTLYAAASFVHQPRVMTSPVDIGTQIPKVLNAVTSRRYGKIPNVTTGIKTLQRGNPGEKVMEYAQGLLADAWTAAGNQWTVGKKPGTAASYVMRLKKTGVDWTVTNGQRGVDVSLSADSTQSRNVIWGRGQRSDGGVWMNKKFPDAGRTAPAYPYSSPGTVMSIGSTDAGTTDGDGVSKWQRRAKALGFHVTVDGVFSSADATVARALQKQYGILVDGIVGPQTWAETFDVGALGADPDQWVRLPLAADPRTQPLLYRANGSAIGPNPAYDPSVTIISDDVDMGTDVDLADGVKSAQQILDRENPAPLTGQLTLLTDPREGSRFSIEPGDRIKLIGYEGRDVVLHIADRARRWSDGSVALQVAEKPMDSLTLAQIRQRNNANRQDPARRPGKVRTKPVIDPWDCESNAGHIERHALYGGLWTVIRVPMSEVGRISEIAMGTTSATRFHVSLFAKPITSAQCIRYIAANPLAADSPGEANRELLEDRFGWLEGWGRSGDALGYYPGKESDGVALSGRFKDAGVDYWSPTGYIYIAEYAAGSCFIEGDMRAAPPEA